MWPLKLCSFIYKVYNLCIFYIGQITIYPVNDAGLPGPSTLLFAAALNTNSQSSDKETMPTTDDDSVFIVSPDLSTADLQVLSRSENYLELFWSDTGADKYTVSPVRIVYNNPGRKEKSVSW